MTSMTSNTLTIPFCEPHARTRLILLVYFPLIFNRFSCHFSDQVFKIVESHVSEWVFLVVFDRLKSGICRVVWSIFLKCQILHLITTNYRKVGTLPAEGNRVGKEIVRSGCVFGDEDYESGEIPGRKSAMYTEFTANRKKKKKNMVMFQINGKTWAE